MRIPSSLFRYRYLAGFAAAALLSIGLARNADAPANPPAAPPAVAAPCTGTFSNGTKIDPAHPKDLADVPGQTVCDFYTFAWNQFIYFTQISFDPNNPGTPDIHNPKTPLFLHLAPWYNLLKKPGAPPPTAYPGGSTALSTAHVDFGQAGTQDHLVDVAGATVLYDIRFNQLMYVFIQTHGVGTKMPTGIYNKTNYDANCAPDKDKNCQIQLWLPPNGATPIGTAGAMEIKSSWRDFGAPGKCPATYYCNGRFGLVGLHLVQKTPNHGEWVWSSFEHVANDPDCVVGGDAPIAAQSPLGTPWAFFDPAKAPPGVMASKTCSVAAGSAQCNLNPKPAGAPAYQQVNICRTDSIVAGGNSAANCIPYPGNNQNITANIACLNATFRPQMPGVWKNYKLIGSLWTRPGATVLTGFQILGFQCTAPSPTCLAPDGLTHMANTTMETWTQAGATGYDPFHTNATQAGCFLCHNLPANKAGVIFSANESTDDLSHFTGKLPAAKIEQLLNSLLPASSTAPGRN